MSRVVSSIVMNGRIFSSYDIYTNKNNKTAVHDTIAVPCFCININHFRTTLYSIRLNIGQLFQHRNNSTSYLIVELYTNFALKAEMCIICDWFVRIVVKIFVITLFYRIWFCVSSIASNCTTCAHCYSFYHYDSQMHGNLIDECGNSICWYVRPNEKQEGIFHLLNAHECEKCIRTENVQR